MGGGQTARADIGLLNGRGCADGQPYRIGSGRPDRACHQLSEHLLDKPPLIIALTGHSREPNCQRFEESGIDMYLVKPVDPLVLRNVLSRFASVVA
jgi:hypothetical protein